MKNAPLSTKHKRNLSFPKLLFILTGLISTVWFLVRVIPKPQRAYYPCMKAAAPIMSSFVIWIIGISGSAIAFRSSERFFRKAKYSTAIVSIFIGILFLGVFTFNSNKQARAVAPDVNPVHPSNEPMGAAQGIKPGRVVWAHDKEATNENCANNQSDPYYTLINNNQEVVSEMIKKSVLSLSDAANLNDAWDKIFKYFNEKKGKGAVGYNTSETIFIKANFGTASWLKVGGSGTDRLDRGWAGFKGNYPPVAETTPVTVYAILDQLVNFAGVPQENIIVADPQSHVWQHAYTYLSVFFPDVIYGDLNGNEDLGRTLIKKSSNPIMQFSDKGVEMTGAIEDSYYEEMENADYLINLAALKAHARAGITLTAKNHFGSQNRGGAAHMHPGLIAPENDVVERPEYGLYRVLVDIMGHEKIGGNTLLFLVDGLWGGTEATDPPVKWQMLPFDNDWPNSIFVSLDQVALESVCFDFLRTEAKIGSPEWSNRPNFAQGIDDYLHQAASSVHWPDKLSDNSDFAGYDPEGDGTYIGSLGTHEHWNNPTLMQYSRNLQTGNGIELIKIADKSAENPVTISGYNVNMPTFDGLANEEFWSLIDWTYIDQLWINNEGAEPDEDDFQGAFKVAWSEEENLLFILAETTDDNLVDGYTCGADGYSNYDVLEIFIDADNSGGEHLMDGVGEVWGHPRGNGENAFSYHIAVNFPVDGNITTEKCIMDLGGDANDTQPVRVQYSDHVPDGMFAVRRTGNKLTWEFALVVYDDTYDPDDQISSVKDLSASDEIGFAVAYCDADGAVGRDHFFGSDWGPLTSGSYNDHWWNSDLFGTVTLVGSAPYVNIENNVVQHEIIRLYPNPVTGNTINIVIPAKLEGKNSQLFIVDQAGRIVISENYVQYSDNEALNINVSNLQRGFYSVVLKTDKNTYTGKFIKR